VRNPSYATLVRLAHALGVKPGELVSLADEIGEAPPGKKSA
jgi:transcriptional regulator with XRE-family HTH domain